MKNEALKRYLLIAMGSITVLYVFKTALLDPLSKQEQRARTEIAKLKPLVERARKQIATTKTLQAADQHAARAAELKEILNTQIPGGASIVWFPQRVEAHFSAQGLKDAKIVPSQEEVFAPLSPLKVANWTVNLPRVGFDQLGRALAELENQEGLIQITQIQIQTVPAYVEFQDVQLELSTFVK